MQNTTRPNLPLSVARAILEDIAAGRIARGGRVVEQAYTERCAVSRTPVREALALLRQARAVRIAARQGARVAATSAGAQRLLRRPPFRLLGNAPATGPAFVELARRVRQLLADPGALPEGTLKDTVVARALGVSRTTANRALARVAREGLLEPLPRRGWRRVTRSPRDYLDWYEFRLAVEPVALRAGWRHFDRPALRQLLVRTRAATHQAALARLGTAARVELDLELHRAIQRACANPFLRRTLEQAEAQFSAFAARMPTWRVPARAEESFVEHLRILEAVLGGSCQAAVAALRSHLIHSRDHVDRELRRARPPARDPETAPGALERSPSRASRRHARSGERNPCPSP